MDNLDCLNVWQGKRLVGLLWRDLKGQIGFRYGHEWLTTDGFPISLSLPLQLPEFVPEYGLAHHFFANLLPEGRVRERIVRNLKIPDTDFDLLQSIGGECAGALVVLPLEQRPDASRKYREISEQDFTDLIRRGGQIDGLHRSDRPRLSLAGAQDKCPILLRDDRYWLPNGNAPTSHILKFESSEYRNVPAYEAYTADLAKAIGLPAANTQLRTFSDSHYLLVERFDRYFADNGKICRLHQEDFCQALGYGFQRKYQEFGGPCFSDCFQLIREISNDPAIDMQNLLRWQIFNVLAGNSDGHAKNLSLLYEPDGETRLAPFYDLVCTRAIASIDRHLAFAIGGERNPDKLTIKHWDRFAADCNLQTRFVRGQVESMAAELKEKVQPCREQFEVRYGKYAALQRIDHVVRTQCKRAIREFSNPR